MGVPARVLIASVGGCAAIVIAGCGTSAPSGNSPTGSAPTSSRADDQCADDQCAYH